MRVDRNAATEVPPGDPRPRDAGERRGRAGLLDALPERARATLLATAVERRFAAGDVLFVAGAPARGLYVVLDGRVRVLRGGGGRSHVLHTERAGGTLREVPLFEGTGYPATAVAATGTRCLLLSRDAVLGAVRAEPELALALLARLAARVRLLVERLDDPAGLSIRGRLAALVLERHRAAGDRPFTIGTTQQEAAEELGTVRELVVRELRALRDRGLIRPTGGGRYLVVDAPALRRLAGRNDAPSGGPPG